MSTIIEELRKHIVNPNPDWIYIGTYPKRMSGWKIHIFAITLEDITDLTSRLLILIHQYELMVKVANQGVIKAFIGKENHIQYGKGFVIYLPCKLFKESNLESFLKDLKYRIKDFNPLSKGHIKGDNTFDNVIHYRYELSETYLPEIGVSQSEYEFLYRRNDGNYNIPDNSDPFIKYLKQ